MPHVKSNRLRAIAVTGTKRAAAMPEILTVSETVPGYDAVSGQAVLGPQAPPRDIRDIAARWNTKLNRLLQLPEMRERLTGDAMELVGGPPSRFLEVLKRDVAKWKQVVKTAGIKAGG